jgi:arabinogalactan endo-1,4-beta-galactosidase
MKTALLPWLLLAVFPFPAAAADPAFVKGADLSLLQFIEDHGVQYKENGRPRDALAIFKEHGCNYVRLRLFVNPDGTQGQVNTLPYTLALAKRAKGMGFLLLLDFHYSDKWADPGHQIVPAGWKELSHRQLAQRVHDYTRDTLAAFQREGCLPDMVEVGNEVTNGFMWPDGGPLKSDANWDAFTDLLKAGIRAVRESGSSKVMIHIDAGDKKEISKWFFDNCRKRGVDYDVIGLSYYPFWSGPLDDLKANLDALSANSGKEVMVAETSYNHAGNTAKPMPFPETPEGQKAYLEALMRTVSASPNGKGVFYWAPEWIEGDKWNGAKRDGGWGDRALFDASGNMLPGMEAYKLDPAGAE